LYLYDFACSTHVHIQTPIHHIASPSRHMSKELSKQAQLGLTKLYGLRINTTKTCGGN